MAIAVFSDRYVGGNAGTPITVSTTASYIPKSQGVSSSGTGTLLRVPFSVKTTSAAAGPSANDLAYLGPLPIGYILAGYLLDVPQMDSSTGLTAELGDSTTAGAYIASGTAFGQAAAYFISGTSSNVAASIPAFYSAYPAASGHARGITVAISGVTYGTDFSSGVADDLIITFTHAVAGTYTQGTITGFYDLVCAEFPQGTVTSNY